MSIFLLAYFGGALTIASPCILPVLPFVFGRADRGFRKGGLPLLMGMTVAFAAMATLTILAGEWGVVASRFGRATAMVLLFAFGLTLLIPRLADIAARPVVLLSERLIQSVDGESATHGGAVTSMILGVATGLLWAPCAGPILGIILTGAALGGAHVQTLFLLLAYAAGAATSLALALLAGEKIYVKMKKMLGVGDWARRALGLSIIVAVAAVVLGLDTGLLSRISSANTTAVEKHLLDALRLRGNADDVSTIEGGPMPDLSGAAAWLNSPPLTKEELKGKVVLVDFWTYSCINCLRTLPYVRAWAEKYRDKGLVVIGVHAPEFAFEKSIDNVTTAVKDLEISYPVAIDNAFTIWRGFDNHYWPAHYFIDATGRVRHHHFGEGGYDESEHVIQSLLAEAGQTDLPGGIVEVDARGVATASIDHRVISPETYIGYGRAENFISTGGQIRDREAIYAAAAPPLNQWGLLGAWTVAAQMAFSNVADSGIVFRFRARDLNLVLGPKTPGKAIHFRITIDGRPPGDDHGLDVNAEGEGVVTGHRLYQLVRQSSGVSERTFEIRFLDAGVEAFAFTFG